MQSRYLRLGWGTFMLVFAGVLLFASLVMIAGVTAGQQPAGAPAIDADDIGGVVTGAQGPEAGVWVIAETRNLPTRFIKSVVTDDRGRYVLPDLPKAEYDVWVRGYGLVDSPKAKASPGKALNIKAVAAPDKKAAAQYYPAQYWYALMQMPPKSDFPGTGESGNGISPNIRAQGEWIRNIVNTDGCTGCHQMGNPATRTIPTSILEQFPDSKMAWDRRIQAGQAGGGMSARFTQVGRQRALAMYADWTDRIAKGELPSATPQRPQGRERNVVVTMWDWRSGRSTCTTRSPATSATPPSIRTGRSMARSKRAATTCQSSIRRRTPRHRSRSDRGILQRQAPAISHRQPPRRTGVTKRSGTARRRCTALRWTSIAASGQPRACANRRRPTGAARDQTIRPQSPPDQPGAARADHVGSEDAEGYDNRHVLHVGHVNIDENDVIWSSFDLRASKAGSISRVDKTTRSSRRADRVCPR
jgi:hypothetical protein